MFPQTLGIFHIDNITNEEVEARIGNTIGPYEDLTSVKRHKLKWYGHVTRHLDWPRLSYREQFKEGD